MIQLSEEIRTFILEKFPLARKRGVQPHDNLLESGILDSLGILEVVTFVESHCGITLSDDDLVPDNFESIDRLTHFVQQRISLRVQA